jgi:flagellar biosynthetic protein FliQ
MESAEVIDICREALIVLLKLLAPVMLASMLVGLTVALFQALTQIQEMTLTFVPKILAVFLTLMLALPFMLRTLTDFTHELAEKIIVSQTAEHGGDREDEASSPSP